jgi:flagella basal body P-ring formation protein FlgA
LAAVASAPATFAADRALAPAPDPGRRRWIEAYDLRQWGLTPLASVTPPVCVERRLHPADSAEVAAAVTRALAAGGTEVRQVEITSFYPEALPAGEMHLPFSGFRALSEVRDQCEFLWYGSYEFDAQRTIPFRVVGRLQALRAEYVAARDLAANEPLRTADFERGTRPGCPAQGDAASRNPDGATLRQALKRGEVIRPNLLKAPLLVSRGETLQVSSTVGAATVKTEAEAESEGARGQSISAKNRQTGKVIRVLLTGPGEGVAVREGAAR